MFSRFVRKFSTPPAVHGEKLMDRFKKIGATRSFDKTDKNVGTGIVGAPACFHGDTKIVVRGVSGEPMLVKISEIVSPTEVLSFNTVLQIFEYRLAVMVKRGIRSMDTVSFDTNTKDEGSVVCTPDHKFLLGSGVYVQNSEITQEMGIVPFKHKLNAQEMCHKGHTKYSHHITHRESFGSYESYTLQVEENNNYVVVINSTPEMFRGIVVKNCGDVLKIQIKVDDNGNIIDSCFKTFGCVSAISSSSLGTELVVGKTLHEAMNIKNTEISSALALEPIKNHCSMLTEEGIKESVRDYLEKNPDMKLKMQQNGFTVSVSKSDTLATTDNKK